MDRVSTHILAIRFPTESGIDDFRKFIYDYLCKLQDEAVACFVDIYLSNLSSRFSAPIGVYTQNK
jgi:hypothetical protein